MLNRIASFSLVIALICTLGGSSVSANTPADPEAGTKTSELSELTTVAKKDPKPNDKLRADMLTLIADAKAGKLTPAERPQIQPAKSNNLSKKTKIAIGVGIAVAVIAIIVYKHQKDHFLDGLKVF